MTAKGDKFFVGPGGVWGVGVFLSFSTRRIPINLQS